MNESYKGLLSMLQQDEIENKS